MRTAHRHRLARALTAILGFASVCMVRDAAAQVSEQDKATATALFLEAKAMMEAGQIEPACSKLAESQRLDPGGGTLLNLALCHEAQGRLATAWTEFKEAVALAKRDGRRDRVSFAQQHIEAIEPRLSRLALVVPEDARVVGLEVRRNGSVVGMATWGSEIPVDGGAYVFEASAPGFQAWKTDVTVSPERDRKSVTVPRLVAMPALVPSAVAPAPGASPAAVTRAAPAPTETGRTAQPAPDRRADGPGVVPFAIGGLGLASLAVGTYFGVRAFKLDNKSDDECRAGACTSQGIEWNDEARLSADISTVTCALGIAAVGVSAWLLASGSSPEKTGRPRVAAGVAPGTATVVFRGAF